MSADSPLAQNISQSLDRQVKEQLALTRAISHPGESGRARENIVRDFIAETLPGFLAADTGFIIDARGQVSRQLDIIIYRNDYHPTFKVGGIRYFLVESVVAVIENKSRIESAAVLNEALDNIASVKALDRTGGGRNRVLIDREPAALVAELVDPRQRFCTEIFGGIVAERSLSPVSFAERMQEFFAKEDSKLWPNYYASVHDFVGCYQVEEEGRRFYSPIAEIASGFAVVKRTSEEPPPLVELLHELLNFWRTAPRIDYSPDAYFGTIAREASNSFAL
jgi:hypothetical protein